MDILQLAMKQCPARNRFSQLLILESAQAPDTAHCEVLSVAFHFSHQAVDREARLRRTVENKDFRNTYHKT